MSDSEEENYCFYGKPLDQYDEDLFPKKRPITVEEQIATDSNGRRRFHGAFTGGFSAGFFNTVGSLEGWAPTEFKSSRSEKQKHVAQNPEDFMDDEDMGEFGFAPNAIKATKDYNTNKKRKRKVFSDGPIPGEPVLHTLLTTGNETVGYLLLKNIGIKEKIRHRDEEVSHSSDKVYGCAMPKTSEVPEIIEVTENELPELYVKYLNDKKSETFGLGYTGLDRAHVNLFRSSDLVVHEKNKKLSIRGQAFGVGAFEEDDDDIYAKEDMSNYDFELTKEKAKGGGKSAKTAGEVFLGAFVKAGENILIKEKFLPPVIPKSFSGKHKVKKSRFEPLSVPKLEESKSNNKLDPSKRAELLGEEVNESFTVSKPALTDSNKSVSSKLETVKTEPGSSEKSSSVVKKFDPASLLDDRFVTGVQEDESSDILAPVKKYESEHYAKEMRDAARLKMFGPLTRISQDWQPNSLLCKRFNVPEPLVDKPNRYTKRTKTKNLIFEYQKHYEENLLKPGLSSQTPPAESEATKNEQNASETTENVLENVGAVSVNPEVKQEITEEDGHASEEVKMEEEKDKSDERDESVVDVTDRLYTEEKADLFKSVFMSSSESEEDESDNEEREKEEKKKEEEENRLREEELKMNVLGQEALILPKIKPVKKGILSDLDLKVIGQPNMEIEVDKKKEKEDLGDDPLAYGPKLPENKMVKNDLKTVETVKCNKMESSSDEDEWVEKGTVEKTKEKKKHKKNKSHKKKKHKHKKKK